MSITYIKPYNAKEYQEKFEELCAWRNTLQTSDADIIEALSNFFLNVPYVLGALGEGPRARFDQNPLYRHDGVDCFTYVNTVLALFFSKGFEEFEQKILDLNYYEGMALYQNRFHFMSADWNPQNAKNGFICDITAEILQDFDESAPELATAFIDKPNWFLHRTTQDIKQIEKMDAGKAETLLEELHDFAEKFSVEKATVPYISLKKLFNEKAEPNSALFDQIPHGSIIEIVRPNWDLRDKIGTHLNISHLGFAFRNNNQLLFRHASLNAGFVTELPLVDYLRENCLKSPTIKGINIYEILAC